MSAHTHADGHPTSHPTSASGHAGHGAYHHVSSTQMFSNVLIVLLILTAVTVGTSRVDFGAANMLIAMFIASVKASLVMAFFMHLKWDTAINKITFLSSFLFLSLLFIFTLADQATRRVDHQANVIKTPVDKQWVHPSLLNAEKH